MSGEAQRKEDLGGAAKLSHRKDMTLQPGLLTTGNDRVAWGPSSSLTKLQTAQ